MNRRKFISRSLAASAAVALPALSIAGAKPWDGSMPHAFQDLIQEGWRIQSQWSEELKAYVLSFDIFNEDRTDRWEYLRLAECDPFSLPPGLAQFYADNVRYAYEHQMGV